MEKKYLKTLMKMFIQYKHYNNINFDGNLMKLTPFGGDMWYILNNLIPLNCKNTNRYWLHPIVDAFILLSINYIW